MPRNIPRGKKCVYLVFLKIISAKYARIEAQNTNTPLYLMRNEIPQITP